MQLVPAAPSPTQPNFSGPLMERVVYELHHTSNTSNDPNSKTPQLNGKLNQVVSDPHHHAERHVLPYRPNSLTNPARIAPFWPDEQNQLAPSLAIPAPARPELSFSPDYILGPYYSAVSAQQKLGHSEGQTGSKLQFIA